MHRIFFQFVSNTIENPRIGAHVDIYRRFGSSSSNSSNSSSRRLLEYDGGAEICFVVSWLWRGGRRFLDLARVQRANACFVRTLRDCDREAADERTERRTRLNATACFVDGDWYVVISELRNERTTHAPALAPSLGGSCLKQHRVR
ncbi:hypothetical protein FI667_g9224, partial [Globisporangium splendens]